MGKKAKSLNEIIDCLYHIFSTIEIMEQLIDGYKLKKFLNDTGKQWEMERGLSIIAEAIWRLPDNFKLKYNHDLWGELWKFRNEVIHEYDTFDIGEVWETVETDIPALKKHVNDLIQILESP